MVISDSVFPTVGQPCVSSVSVYCYSVSNWKKEASLNQFANILIWLGLATNQVLADSTSKPPFREGIEYRYEWEASMESDSGVNNQVATSTWLRGQIYVITKVEDTKWRSLLKVSFFLNDLKWISPFNLMFLYRSRMFLWRSSMGKNLLRLAMHLSNWRNLTNSWANRFIFSTRDPKFVSKIKKVERSFESYWFSFATKGRRSCFPGWQRATLVDQL